MELVLSLIYTLHLVHKMAGSTVPLEMVPKNGAKMTPFNKLSMSSTF